MLEPFVSGLCSGSSEVVHIFIPGVSVPLLIPVVFEVLFELSVETVNSVEEMFEPKCEPAVDEPLNALVVSIRIFGLVVVVVVVVVESSVA